MKFVAIEGVDGSGSTTQKTRVVTELQRLGFRVRGTSAPFHSSPFESAIRAILSDPDVLPLGTNSDETLLSLFLADRKVHWAAIRSWADHTDLVITDRWHMSTAVYQGARLKKDVFDLYDECAKRTGAPKADKTFLLNVDLDEARGRVMLRTKTDSYEEDTALQRSVAAGYHLLASCGCAIPIRRMTVEEVTQELVKQILPML